MKPDPDDTTVQKCIAIPITYQDHNSRNSGGRCDQPIVDLKMRLCWVHTKTVTLGVRTFQDVIKGKSVGQ